MIVVLKIYSINYDRSGWEFVWGLLVTWNIDAVSPTIAVKVRL